MPNLLTTSVPNILPKRIPIVQRAPAQRIVSNAYTNMTVTTPKSSQTTHIHTPQIDATSQTFAIPIAQNLITHEEENSEKNPSSVGDSNVSFDASIFFIFWSANVNWQFVLMCNFCLYLQQNSGSSTAKHFIRSFADYLEERNALIDRQFESRKRKRNVQRQSLFSAYYSLDLNGKNVMLFNCIQRKEVKHHRKNAVKQKQNTFFYIIKLPNQPWCASEHFVHCSKFELRKLKSFKRNIRPEK